MNVKKTLVAAAVAAVVAAPAVSYASATMYGSVELGLTKSGKAQGNGYSSTRFLDNGSRIGFKGTNDLGNGLTGFYNMELGIDTFYKANVNTGGNAYNEHKGQLYTRLGYFGVKGHFGTVIAGRQHGLYYSLIEQPTDVTNVLNGPLNPIGFAYSVASINGTSPNVSTASLTTGYKDHVNALAYVSPNMSGFVGGVAYADIGTYDTSGASQSGKQQGVYQIGGKYSFDAGPGSAYVGLAYMGVPKNNYAFGFVKNVWGLSGGYKFGMFSVDANYQQAKPRTNGPEGLPGNNNNKNIKSAAIQGAMSMGPLYAYLEYSQMKWKYASDKTAQRTTAGVFYNIAKPLQVTFEVSRNNKYVANALTIKSGTNYKGYTSVALGANYYF